MAKVTYTARIEVSESEIVNLMTVEYGEHGWCYWTAMKIRAEKGEDGVVEYVPAGERKESFPVAYTTHKQALESGVQAILTGKAY